MTGAPEPSRRGVGRRTLALLLLALVGLLSVACGSSEQSASPTLRWYVFKEPGGAFAEAAARCTQASGGRYRIELADLPPSADQQREQLVRRLAARDSDIDIMGMDVIWTAEFAEAGWLLPWEAAAAARASGGAIGSTLKSGMYKGRLWAAPYTTNAQLLWYRKDRVPAPPATWDEMVATAERLGPQGKIQVQGNRYEGLTVWVVSLLASAGGQVLDDAGNLALPAGPTTRTLETLRRVATSPAADPALSTAQEDDARLAFETGDSSFMVNYTFVWPSAQENAPQVAANMGWARWPRVNPDEPSHVTVGGINIGVGAYSKQPELAFEAAECLRSPDNQVVAAEKGGLPPTNEALYDDPRIRQAFPFADVLRDTLRDATQRPQTPAYNDVSLAIQRTVHPPRSVQPQKDAEQLRSRVGKTLKSGGLL
jgi:multiple sugar transport system substrate-binding protein